MPSSPAPLWHYGFRHPLFPKCLCEDEEGYYVVMEKVLGKDLFDTLRELEGPMPMAEMSHS